MRVFISIIFLIASTLIGVILSVNYSKKTKFYTYFLSFHKKYLNELNFSLKTLISLIDELDCDNDFNLLLIQL